VWVALVCFNCMYDNDSISSLWSFALEKQSWKPKIYINSCLTHSMLARFLRSFVQDCRPLINYTLIYYFVIMNRCSTDEPEQTCSPFFEGKDCTRGIPSHFVLCFFRFCNNYLNKTLWFYIHMKQCRTFRLSHSRALGLCWFSHVTRIRRSYLLYLVPNLFQIRNFWWVLMLHK